MVDDGEELDTLGLQDGLEAGDGFVDGMIAGSAKDAVFWNWRHGSLPRLRCIVPACRSDGNQINGHGHAEYGKDQSSRDCQRRWTRKHGFRLLKLLQKAPVADER